MRRVYHWAAVRSADGQTKLLSGLVNVDHAPEHLVAHGVCKGVLDAAQLEAGDGSVVVSLTLLGIEEDASESKEP